MLKTMSTKKLLSTILATVMLFSAFAVVSASGGGVDPEKTAIYLNGFFDGQSATVNGDIYSANGDATFNNAGDNRVSGSIYLNAGKQLKLPAWYTPDFSNRVVKLDSTEFNAPEKAFMTVPVIENYVASFKTGDDSELEKVVLDTHYGKLEISKILKVDVSEGDRYIAADAIVFSSNGYIEPVGGGSLFLFINGNLAMTGSQTIKGSSDTDVRNHVFVSGDVNLKNDTEGNVMYANLYVSGSNVTINTTELYGNVVSNNAASFQMTGSNSKIYGTVYTPAANASVRGSGKIYGRIVANTMYLFGNGEINYNESYVNLTMPSKPVAEKYTVTVKSSPATGGDVTPSSVQVNSGETVTLSVTTNEGYEFVGYTSDDGSQLPDESGNITVAKDVNLTANFQPASSPVPPDMDIPEGDSLLINFPYAYLYGNEDGTAGAENSIKREEAVALIYRLLKQDNKLDGFVRGSVEPYDNIESGRWSRSALEFMKYIGVYNTSYISAGTYITRGEVAKIICFALRIRPDDSKTINFVDLAPDNKSYHYIKALADIGMLQGYDDRIEPDSEMTRAEFVTMVNRMIGRGGGHEVIDGMNPYSDLTGDKWYYEDIMRASFGYYDTKDGSVYKINPEGKPDRYSIDYN